MCTVRGGNQLKFQQYQYFFNTQVHSYSHTTVVLPKSTNKGQQEINHGNIKRDKYYNMGIDLI